MENMKSNYQPFQGVKVIELASVLAGPSVGMFLAELGADVIKVEHPGTGGDVTRSWKLPDENPSDPQSSYFDSVNRGKRSLFLNLNYEADRNQLEDEIKTADIILVSFKPGDAKKLNLTYQDIKKLQPEMIYAAITGFGKNDPRTAYDALLQAETGFMYLNREPNGEPLKMPVALIDVLAAHHLKELILIAWIEKLKTGKGCEIEVSLFEAALSSLMNQASAFLYAGVEPEPMGSEHPHIYPYGVHFTCRDQRQIVLAIGNDRQFKILCDLLDADALSENPNYQTNQSRSKNRKLLKEHLQNLFLEVSDSEEFLEKCIEKRLPVGKIRTVSEAITEYKSKGRFLHGGIHETLPALSGNINGKVVTRALKIAD